MEHTQRALVICAHDDDEVIGPGGTIRKLADSGVRVTTLVFAEGNEGYSSIEVKDTIVARRRSEREQAQSILGTSECIAHGYHDYSNLDCEAVYREVIRVARLARPHVVFSHLPTDYLAHRTLANVVPEAVWQAGWVSSTELGEPWRVGSLYLFSVLELTAKPTHVVDITNTFGAKTEAMRAYASQHEVVSGILDGLEVKARTYGGMIGVRYGEAFVRSSYQPQVVSDPVRLLDV